MATPVMKMGDTQTFALPQGWTIRQVATLLAREWVTPLRPTVETKSARWIVQPHVEEPAGGQPLWEEGISTSDYERRLESPDLIWSVQARAGRPRGTSLILARLTLSPAQPGTFDMVCAQDAIPETLLDRAKVSAFLGQHGLAGADGLFAGLLMEHGFRRLP